MGLSKKNLGQPDETRAFGHGHMAIVRLPDLVFGKAVFEPGWRWSQDVKPIAKTESCMTNHHGYVISGRLGMRMNDGTEIEVGPGDAFVCPPGHDAWTIGDEACVALDFAGATTYAKPA